MLDLYEKPGYKMKLRNRIKWWFRRHKYARQRARWGFSEYDVWDFHSYHAELVSAMLTYWADKTNSHPCDVNEKDWQNLLRKIASCFKQWNEELPTPAYDAYRAAAKRIKNEDDSITVEVPDELLKAWHKEEWENYEIKRNKLKEGFELLYKFYPNLWD